MKYMNVAIDGPAGAGKSTIAKKVAADNGFIYVDTGAMYRALGLYLTRSGIAPDDLEKIVEVLPSIDVSISYEDGVQQVYLNGENVSTLIRTEEAGNMASACSVHAPVRVKMVELQQKIAAENNCVMDGRDIGTVVLPDAPVKIFLTASAEERARRRYNEYLEKGKEADYDKILEDIKDRDYRDTHRENSPLMQAKDAILIDSSDMTPIEVQFEIQRYIVNNDRNCHCSIMAGIQ